MPNVDTTSVKLSPKVASTWISKKNAIWNNDVKRLLSQMVDMGIFKKFSTQNVSIAASQKWAPITTPSLKPLSLPYLALQMLVLVIAYFFVAVPVFFAELCLVSSK